MITMDGEIIAQDAKIEIPRDGITLKHDGHVIAKVSRADVEVVSDSRGIILYLNLPLTHNNAQFVEEIKRMLRAGSEIEL